MDFKPINLNVVGMKAKSKGEVYQTLVTEGRFYLMRQRECGPVFLSKICIDRNWCFLILLFFFNYLILVLFSEEVKDCQVLHTEGLRSENIINLIVNKWGNEDYRPFNYIDILQIKYIFEAEILLALIIINKTNTLNSVEFDGMISKKWAVEISHSYIKQHSNENRSKNILGKQNLLTFELAVKESLQNFTLGKAKL